MSLAALVIHDDEARVLAERLDAYLGASRATMAVLVDRSGQVIAERGYTERRTTEELAALSAAAFAATEHVARLLGENSFTVLFHEGEERNLHLTICGDSALLLTSFDRRTTLGLVRLYAEETARALAAVVERARLASPDEGLPVAPAGDLFQAQPDA